MPVSPRHPPTPNDNPTGSSDAEHKRSRNSHPTSKKRNRRQKLKAAYAKAREDAQLAGIIPTAPEGAVRDERVDPRTQTPQPLSELVAAAIRKGWAVEDGMKPHLVDEMVRIVMDVDMPAKAKIAAFSALRMADQSQWEREHPTASPTAKGGTSAIAISVQTNISAKDLMERMIADGSLDLRQISGSPAPIITSSVGGSRFAGTVESETTPTGDKPEAGASLGDTEQSDGDCSAVPAR